jgi:hypothetical protein
LKENITLNNNEEIGQYMAVKGLVSLKYNKKKKTDLLGDTEKMARLRKLQAKQLESIWRDDFERGYFETWVKFINFWRRNSLSGVKESIDNDPSKKEKHEKAS